MKKLAGQQIVEHDGLALDLEDDVIEYRRQMEPDIINNIQATIENAKKHDLYKNKDFYVVMLSFIDRVLRQPVIKIFARRSCPTPLFKQSVWKYNHSSGSLDYLWTLPDSLVYYHIVREPAKFLGDKETADMAKFVLLDNSGELLEWVKKENGEKKDAVLFNKENACLMN